MGSNVGTTISSQLYAFNVDEYPPLALAVGFGLLIASRRAVFGKNERLQHIGMIVLRMGLIFFGLKKMGDAVEPLEGYEPFIDLRARMKNPLFGAVVGALFTLVIQSSSATLGVIIALAAQGLITLPAGIALMLGTEIGTTSDTLVASIGRSRAAIRTVVFHLVVTVTTVVLGVIFASQLAQLAQWISGEAGLSRQIANAQLVFNVLGVLLFIGFVPLIAWALETVIPKRPDEERRAEAGGAARP